jgi:predicted RNase H-like HicB family nuclease
VTVRRVAVIYHWEPEGYWGDAPDVPGFSAAGKTLEEVREQAREGLAFHSKSPLNWWSCSPTFSLGGR